VARRLRVASPTWYICAAFRSLTPVMEGRDDGAATASSTGTHHMSEQQQQPEAPRATERANPHPFAWGCLMAVFVVTAGMMVVLFTLGPPSSAEGVGRVLADFALPAVLAAVITAFIARASKRSWGWWRYLLVVAAISLALFAFFGVASR
jgi:hypothetical protein